MNSVYRLMRRCGVALTLGLAPFIAAVLPATPANAAGISAVSFTDRCDGGVDVALPNKTSSGNAIYTVNEDIVVVAPGQRSVHAVAPPSGGDPLVVDVSLQERDGQEDRTSHTWEQPDDCDAQAAGDASDRNTAGGGQYDGDGAADGYGPAGDGPDYGVDAVDQGVIGQAAIAEDPVAVAGEPVDALAVTGTNTMLVGAAGVALILVGAAMLRLRRRKIRFEAK